MSCPFFSTLVAASLATTIHTAQAEEHHRSWVDAATKRVIEPAYADFSVVAEASTIVLADLCEDPSAVTLEASRDTFAELVVAFARIEPYRFGPARSENRIERLFFWPDPRSRGLRQVQAILSSQDGTATTQTSLYQKSVAAQGIPALDFVLSGAGSEMLETPDGDFRCRYGLAIAQNIAAIASELRDQWVGAEGYAARMRAAGPDQPTYRSPSEALSEILRAAREQTQIVRDFKLARVLGDAFGKAKPKRAPLWRSSLSLDMVHANLSTVAALLSSWPTEGSSARSDLRDQALFELGQARAVIAEIHAQTKDIAIAVNDPSLYERLSYATIPLEGAERLLTERIPASLGLGVGFNSLDGD